MLAKRNAPNCDIGGALHFINAPYKMAVELIALSEWEPEQDLIFGCVTIGELWIFGILDKKQRLIQQNIDSLRVPGDIEVLVDVLVGILEKA